MKKPELKDYNKGGSMIAPYGTPDYEAYSIALDAYIDELPQAKDNEVLDIVSFRVWGNWWRDIGDTERLRLRDKHYPKSVKQHMDVFNCMAGRIKKIYIREHDS